MTYLEWVDRVLLEVERLTTSTPAAQLVGVDRVALAGALGGSWEQLEFGHALHQATADLGQLSCLDNEAWHYRLTNQGIRFARAGGLRPGWKSLFDRIHLLPEDIEFLAIGVSMAERQGDVCAHFELIEAEDVQAALGWVRNKGSAIAVLKRLESEFAIAEPLITSGWAKFRPSYLGVVLATQLEPSQNHTLLAALVEDWETTSVDFKERLDLSSPTQKAEFVKDILALATTRVSGRRFLVLGFNDKTRQFTTSVQAGLSAHQLESILGAHSEPVPNVTLTRVPWADGSAGLVEVFSDPGAVPYRLKRGVGKYRAGTVFVRHNTLVEEPSALELELISQQGQRARGEVV